MSGGKHDLSLEERQHLIQTLNALPSPQFDELVFVLNPPPGNIPGHSAPQASRGFALLNWVESPIGPGLEDLKVILAGLRSNYTQTPNQVFTPEQMKAEPQTIEALLEIIKTLSQNQASKYDLRGAQFGGSFAETVKGDQIGGEVIPDRELTSVPPPTPLLAVEGKRTFSENSSSSTVPKNRVRYKIFIWVLGVITIGGIGTVLSGSAALNFFAPQLSPDARNVNSIKTLGSDLKNLGKMSGFTLPETLLAVEYSQKLNIAPGQNRTVTGNLRKNETIDYHLGAAEGQVLLARIAREGVLLTVLNSQGQPVERSAQRVLNWQGTLPTDGEYTLQLRPVQGLEQSDYELEVSLSALPQPTPSVEPQPEPSVEPPPVVTPSPEPTPTPKPDANVLEQRVQIPPGRTDIEVSGQVNENRIHRYIINAQEGQVLALELLTVSGPVTLDVRFPGGELIPDSSRVLSWQGQLPTSGDYIVDVSSPRPSNYVLKVSVN